MLARRRRGRRNCPNIDCHIVVEVVSGCDDADAILVLEADAILIQPVEVLDSGDDRLCGIMR